MNPQPDKQLSDLLKGWDVSAEVPHTFRTSVWSQIASREEAREDTLLNRAAQMVSAIFARPAYATATAVVALFLSVGAAHVHAASVSAKRIEVAQSEYLTSISPLAQVNSGDHRHDD